MLLMLNYTNFDRIVNLSGARGSLSASHRFVPGGSYAACFDKMFSFPYNTHASIIRPARAIPKGVLFMQNIISLIAVLIMAGGLGGVYYLIIKQNASLGIKAIHFIAVVFTLPLLLVLGLYNVLGRETIGTILGVVIGYVLSGFGKE